MVLCCGAEHRESDVESGLSGHDSELGAGGIKTRGWVPAVMIEVVLVAVSVLHFLAFILFVGSLRHVSPTQTSSSTDGVLSSLADLVGKFERILHGVDKVVTVFCRRALS